MFTDQDKRTRKGTTSYMPTTDMELVKAIIATNHHILIKSAKPPGKTVEVVHIGGELLRKGQQPLFLTVTKQGGSEIQCLAKYLLGSGEFNYKFVRNFAQIASEFLKANRQASFTPTHPYCFNEPVVVPKLKYLDQEGQSSELGGVVKSLGFQLSAAELEKILSTYNECFGKREKVDVGCFTQLPLKKIDLEVIIRSYEKKRLTEGHYNFHDTLEVAANLLKTNTNLAISFKFKFPVVIVNHFEELNRPKVDLLIALAKVGTRIIAFGQPCDCEFSFSGGFDESFDLLADALSPNLLAYCFDSDQRQKEKITKPVDNDKRVESTRKKTKGKVNQVTAMPHLDG